MNENKKEKNQYILKKITNTTDRNFERKKENENDEE
jgi:hypothetical protein